MASFALGQRSYGEVYEQIYRQHPELRYVGFYRLFNEPAILVRDQRLVREVLVGSSFLNCADNAVNVDAQRDVLATCNPFIASGDRWRILRADLVPLFTPSRLRQTLPHVAAACQQLQEFVGRRLTGERFEAKALATRYTLQVIASAVFGLDAHCLCYDEDQEKGSQWLQRLLPLFQPSAWSLLETIALLHSSRLANILQHRYVPLSLQDWLCALVRARSGANNFLHWLGDKQGEQGDLAGHATTLLLEGYETSAMLLAFALYELSRNESAQRRVQTELEEVAQRHGGLLVGHAALAELRYAEAALLETLRLHPAMQALQKRCTKSFTLPPQRSDTDTAVGSHGSIQVALGTVLVLPVQAIHMDPNLYSDPLKFQPERFMDTSPMGCRFLGFGAGPRMCPGMRLGLAQTKAALVTLLRDYSFSLADQAQDPVQVSPLTFLTASKHGIWLQLQKR
ncbi:probable cytochrome P450 308a1 isoform X1 [Drosophila pseudoobscura]|uniref:Probable cytochrome P450 308a1 isoform X1 n=1 Tax=Drosophila pseudoobscura pseudoobscura TaxID=46245 RepID=A0A6I8UF06_DROPS|nr:probable cytochrome P450 308a1 isoform X1 [Drosophila pseudoobscura]